MRIEICPLEEKMLTPQICWIIAKNVSSVVRAWRINEIEKNSVGLLGESSALFHFDSKYSCSMVCFFLCVDVVGGMPNEQREFKTHLTCSFHILIFVQTYSTHASVVLLAAKHLTNTSVAPQKRTHSVRTRGPHLSNAFCAHEKVKFDIFSRSSIVFQCSTIPFIFPPFLF